MNLESRARRLQSDQQYYEGRDRQVIAPIGTVWRLLTQCGDQGREPTLLELRLIAKELDRVEELLGKRVDRTLGLIDQVIEFAEAVNDAMADAETGQIAPEWSVQVNGLDEEAIDRIARFYTDRGHDIR